MTTTSPTPLRQLIEDQFSLDEALTVNDLAGMLRELIDITADVNAVRTEIEQLLADRMELDNEETPFGVLVRTRGGRRTNWHGEEVRKRIVRRFAEGVDPDTGEVLEDPKTIASRVAEDFAQCAGTDRASHGWRSGELKKRKIQLSDVCEYVDGKVSVRFA